MILPLASNAEEEKEGEKKEEEKKDDKKDDKKEPKADPAAAKADEDPAWVAGYRPTRTWERAPRCDAGLTQSLAGSIEGSYQRVCASFKDVDTLVATGVCCIQ